MLFQSMCIASLSWGTVCSAIFAHAPRSEQNECDKSMTSELLLVRVAPIARARAILLISRISQSVPRLLHGKEHPMKDHVRYLGACAMSLLFISTASYAGKPQDTYLFENPPDKPFKDVMTEDKANKPKVMDKQKDLIDQRYDLGDKPSSVKMSGGRKAVQKGVRVKLPKGMTWEKLAKMSPDEIRDLGLYPAGFLPLPHVKHEVGGQANAHTNASLHLTPDLRPQAARFRHDTVSLRGLFNQQIHGSKRSLLSVEDFSEFEQRTAYFDGDQVVAQKKVVYFPERHDQTSVMAQMQNMFDFPPAPKLDSTGKLDPSKASPQEMKGQELFFGKARCAECHPAPAYLDHQMHDLKLERFFKNQTISNQFIHGDGPIKTFTLRGIKDSPPYFHDGRLLTLDDTVEFFNLVLGLNLSQEEKEQLVAFMLTL